jgi:hypothetical protein
MMYYLEVWLILLLNPSGITLRVLVCKLYSIFLVSNEYNYNNGEVQLVVVAKSHQRKDAFNTEVGEQSRIQYARCKSKHQSFA